MPEAVNPTPIKSRDVCQCCAITKNPTPMLKIPENVKAIIRVKKVNINAAHIITNENTIPNTNINTGKAIGEARIARRINQIADMLFFAELGYSSNSLAA